MGRSAGTHPFHLIDRLKERQITTDELHALKRWIETNPYVPEGKWYKKFGNLTVCGEGRYPKTFLGRGQAAEGQEV